MAPIAIWEPNKRIRWDQADACGGSLTVEFTLEASGQLSIEGSGEKRQAPLWLSICGVPQDRVTQIETIWTAELKPILTQGDKALAAIMQRVQKCPPLPYRRRRTWLPNHNARCAAQVRARLWQSVLRQCIPMDVPTRWLRH